MNCIKRLSERVMSHSVERQVNELQVRAAILIGLLNRAARRRWLWYSHVRGWGKPGLGLIYATAPADSMAGR